MTPTSALIFTPNPTASVRLFCFHNAGASAAIFRPWASALPRTIEVVAVELPGHGRRIAEPLHTELPELAARMGSELWPLLREKPFALFGHSMGALLSFELARYLRRTHQALPLCLIPSARQAPQLPPTTAFYQMPEAELKAALGAMNGTPREVLEHDELMELLLPVIRADFQVCERYDYQEEAPLDCPILACGGVEDHSVPRATLEPWAAQTSVGHEVRLFPGDHFYLRPSQTALLQAIVQLVRRCTVPGG